MMTKREAIKRYFLEDVIVRVMKGEKQIEVRSKIVGWAMGCDLNEEFGDDAFLIALIEDYTDNAFPWSDVGSRDYIAKNYENKKYEYIMKDEIVGIVWKPSVENYTGYITIRDCIYSVEYTDRNIKTYLTEQQVFFGMCEGLKVFDSWNDLSVDKKISMIEKACENIGLNVAINKFTQKIGVKL